MNRRGFLAGILAAGVAPAVVGSGILMPTRKLVTPDLVITPLATDFHPNAIQLTTSALRVGDVFTIEGFTRSGRKDDGLQLFVVTAASERDGVVTVDVAGRAEAPRRIQVPKNNKPWPKQGRWA